MGRKLSKEHKKTIALSSLGGTLEFYDFIIFIFFANSISKLFFPAQLSDFLSLLNTYATFAVGYFARPLGGVIIAHYGDKLGRKNMFMLSILLMVIPTFVVGIMPTFEKIGYFAPLILILIRILQGVAIGAELPGAWTFVSEHVKRAHVGIATGILTSSVVGGILLGSIVSLIVRSIYNDSEVDSYAWRIPFILGGIFGIISIFLRRYLEETPIFKEIKESNNIVQFPIKDVIAKNKKGIILSILITWVLTACVLIFVLMLPTQLGKIMQISAQNASLLQMAGIFCVVIGCIVCGYLKDKTNIATSGTIYAICLLIASFIFFNMLFSTDFSNEENILMPSLLYLISCFFCGITCITPLIMLDLFPANVRFSAISFSYNISYAIFGGLTPIFFQIAISKSHEFFSYYFVLMALIAIFCSIVTHKMRPK